MAIPVYQKILSDTKLKIWSNSCYSHALKAFVILFLFNLTSSNVVDGVSDPCPFHADLGFEVFADLDLGIYFFSKF